MKTKSILPIAGAAVIISSVAQSQTTMSADENAIRDMVARADAGDRLEQTPDAIFFSGAVMRPVVRGEAPAEPRPEVMNRVPGTQRTKSRIRRIEIAAAGDMAYVFIDGTLTNQIKRPDGQVGEESASASALRVFKKVNGKWLLAATLAGPHPR